MKTKLLSVTTLVVLIGLIVTVWIKQQQIVDWWRLRGYTPSAAVAELATEDTMNAYTRHLFYLNRPRLLSTVTAFRQYCPENSNTIVLGCYHPDQNGIFIYDVQDPTLAGLQQVTAAHEVLHSIYARLSSSQRKTLDIELESYYEHGLTDTNVKAEVTLYKQTEPTAVYDEMSCTFGTEIATLPSDLEAYYAQFFTDRQIIVTYEEQYQVQFTSRQQQIAGYDSQLNTMKKQIDSEESSLNTEDSSLQSQHVQLKQLLASGQNSAYNADVSGYNEQVDSYNASVASLRLLINSYNQLVSTRNAVAGQLTTIDSAIDTRVPSTVSP